MSGPKIAPATLLELLASEMAGALAALAGDQSTPTAVATPTETTWLVHLRASGIASGDAYIGLSDIDARRASALIMGDDAGQVADEAVVDTLREIGGQAIGALAQMAETKGIGLAIAEVVRQPFVGTPTACYGFALPTDFTLSLLVGGTISIEPPSDTRALAVEAAVPVNVVAPPAVPPNLELLLDIQLPLSVRFGSTELTLATLTRLGPGSVIDLHRSADEPVDVLIGGKVVARGEVVVVEGNYGVRVTEVASTADRIKSLGA
jgi:flagellar motor switch protein FliN